MNEKVKNFYEMYYSEVVTSGLVGKYQAHIHSLIEKDLPLLKFESVLELGAGKLEHPRRTQISFGEYWATDLQMQASREVVKLKDEKTGSLKKINTSFLDAQNLGSIASCQFDLLLATCLLIHLPSPYEALLGWRRVVSNKGFVVIYVPCDPGMLIRFMRQITVKKKYKKLGFEGYDLICSLEHLGSLHVLNNLIKDVFAGDLISIRRGPFGFLKSWNFNLFYIYTIQVQKDCVYG